MATPDRVADGVRELDRVGVEEADSVSLGEPEGDNVMVGVVDAVTAEVGEDDGLAPKDRLAVGDAVTDCQGKAACS